MTHKYEEIYNLPLEYIKRSFKLDFINCFCCSNLYPHSKKYYQEVRIPINKLGWLRFMPAREKVIKFYHLKFDWCHSKRVFSVILPLPLFINENEYYVRIDNIALKNLLIDKIKESLGPEV
jgi:hypothetical protein